MSNWPGWVAAGPVPPDAPQAAARSTDTVAAVRLIARRVFDMKTIFISSSGSVKPGGEC